MSQQARAIGTETEYGIATPEQPELSPIYTSTEAVLAYADNSGVGAKRTRWDYEPESPLRDTRGFDLRRYHTNRAPVLDPNAIGAANMILPSGARFYVDHAHPEYSSPEVTDALSAVIWDKAGDIVMHQAGEAAESPIKLYKNNVDGKGASYGSHENYLYQRAIDFDTVADALIPFFVTRQIYTGAGRVGLGQKGDTPGFQISQRADYIETPVSLETTLNRGIINTRDEPHATEQWRRLHVIIGDANMSEYSAFLKFGVTSLVIAAIEAGVDFSDLALDEPVAAVQTVSRDLELTAKLALADRRTTYTAIEIQQQYRQRILAAIDSGTLTATTVDQQVLSVWQEILDDLGQDVMSTADRLDWTAKLQLLEQYRQRGSGQWNDPRLQLIDLQYSDIDPNKGLYYALVRRGRIKTLVDPEDILAAVDTPPAGTRAYFRGRMIARFGADVLAANWDNLTVAAGEKVYQIALPDPLSLNADEVFDIIEAASSTTQVVEKLLPRGIVTSIPLPERSL